MTMGEDKGIYNYLPFLLLNTIENIKHNREYKNVFIFLIPL